MLRMTAHRADASLVCPIDVNDVLCLGGKVCEKQMLGVHMPKNVDITGLSHFLPHPSGVRRMGVHRVFTPF